MVWFIVGACVLALVVLALVLTLLRFNQLSMARSLCDEAKRQLLVELRGRHALVPAYIGTLQQVTTQDLSSVELALASAERAPFGPRGAAAESALTRAVDDAAQIPSQIGDRAIATDSSLAMQASPRDELDTTIALLHGQLNVLTERILSGARIYNTNVDLYHRQRERVVSRLFQNVFKAREPFTEVQPQQTFTEAQPQQQSGAQDQSGPAGS
ncbi:LemA family protein [Brevibacterium sp. CBA3109]|uniref:LemA family protein n=1 Tax=Brevibacterium koreense TaxID=3140787 RepID=A0AAU7UJQ5_9MICO